MTGDARETRGEATYPRLDGAEAAVVTRPYSQRTWIGDREQLVRLQTYLLDVLEEVYNREVLNVSTDDTYAARRELEDLRDSLRLRVEVVGRDRKWTQTGNVGDILSDVDPAEVYSIEMWSGRYSHSVVPAGQVRVKMSDFAHPLVDVAQVQISGTDKTWVAGVQEQVAALLGKGIPWWDRLRRLWVPISLGLAVSAGLLIILNDLIPVEQPTPVFTWTVAVPAALALGIVGQATTQYVWRWALPGFDLVTPGRRSRGDRRLSAMWGLVGFAVSSIVLPLLLR